MNILKSKPIIIFFLTIFIISLNNATKNIPGSFNNFMIWIVLIIHFLAIGYLIKLLYPSYTLILKRISTILVSFSLYMALGTGILHYQGEGGYRSDLLQSNIGNKLQYNIELHNGFKLPLNIDFALLYGERGLEKISALSSKIDKEGTKDDYRVVNLTFKVTEKEAMLPKNVVVIYRIFGFVPMVNIIETK